MFAVGNDLAFDCLGFSPARIFISNYREAFQARFPQWDASFAPLELDPLGLEYCRKTISRLPSEFPYDVIARARAFLERFKMGEER